MSDSVYQELIAAGAPELPPDYCYKVVLASEISELRVYLQKRRVERTWWGGSRTVYDNVEQVSEFAWELVGYPYKDDRTAVSIIAGHCRTLYERHIPSVERFNEFTAYVGRHP